MAGTVEIGGASLLYQPGQRSAENLRMGRAILNIIITSVKILVDTAA